MLEEMKRLHVDNQEEEGMTNVQSYYYLIEIYAMYMSNADKKAEFYDTLAQLIAEDGFPFNDTMRQHYPYLVNLYDSYVKAINNCSPRMKYLLRNKQKER